MIGRRSILGLSLLAMLAFCAFGAQGASAWETATNTTVFECSKSAVPLDFADAHCDTTSSKGTFGHKEIKAGTSVEIETSNEATAEETKARQPAVLKGSVLGSSVTITAKKVSPDPEVVSFVKNIQTGEPATAGDFEGTSAVNFTEISLVGNGAPNCKVVEPITLKTLFHGVEQTTENEKKEKIREMAIEFTPDPSTSKIYVTIKFEGAGCVFKEANVEGSARGTGSGAGNNGATLKFLPADEELKFLGAAATFEGIFTTKVKSTGNALVTTTTK